MKKIILTLILSLFISNAGFCELSSDEINIYNLKTSNMYLLNLKSNVKNIDISDKNIVNISPISSISSSGKQLFVEANSAGICDAIIETTNKTYKVRFINGKLFDEEKDDLTVIDFPTTYKKEK